VNFRLTALFISVLACWLHVFGGQSEIAGKEIAERVLAQKPAQDWKGTGTLKILRSGSRIEMLVRMEQVVQSNVLISVYEVEQTTNLPITNSARTFSVFHEEGQPNRYFFGKPGGLDPINERAAATLSFAGSDFTISDLGMEFFHWPVQRLLKAEMRKGRPCNVVESTTPDAQNTNYNRILTWIDTESYGILLSEAFNKDKMVKEFTLKSIKKVNDNWQIKEIEMTNKITGSCTHLHFDLGQQK
jgi:hypothetical protein